MSSNNNNNNNGSNDHKQHVRWQIPRASLSSGSRSFHSSTDSIQKTFDQHHKHKRRESYSVGQRKKIPAMIEEGPYSMPSQSLSSSSSSTSTYHGNFSSSSLPLKQQQQQRRQQKKKFSRKQLTENLDEIVVDTPELVHGSSSQGSSSNSLHVSKTLDDLWCMHA
jgi:hypothetical protein